MPASPDRCSFGLMASACMQGSVVISRWRRSAATTAHSWEVQPIAHLQGAASAVRALCCWQAQLSSSRFSDSNKHAGSSDSIPAVAATATAHVHVQPRAKALSPDARGDAAASAGAQAQRADCPGASAPRRDAAAHSTCCIAASCADGSVLAWQLQCAAQGQECAVGTLHDAVKLGGVAASAAPTKLLPVPAQALGCSTAEHCLVAACGDQCVRMWQVPASADTASRDVLAGDIAAPPGTHCNGAGPVAATVPASERSPVSLPAAEQQQQHTGASCAQQRTSRDTGKSSASGGRMSAVADEASKVLPTAELRAARCRGSAVTADEAQSNGMHDHAAGNGMPAQEGVAAPPPAPAFGRALTSAKHRPRPTSLGASPLLQDYVAEALRPAQDSQHAMHSLPAGTLLPGLLHASEQAHQLLRRLRVAGSVADAVAGGTSHSGRATQLRRAQAAVLPLLWAGNAADAVHEVAAAGALNADFVALCGVSDAWHAAACQHAAQLAACGELHLAVAYSCSAGRWADAASLYAAAGLTEEAVLLAELHQGASDADGAALLRRLRCQLAVKLQSSGAVTSSAAGQQWIAALHTSAWPNAAAADASAAALQHVRVDEVHAAEHGNVLPEAAVSSSAFAELAALGGGSDGAASALPQQGSRGRHSNSTGSAAAAPTGLTAEHVQAYQHVEQAFLPRDWARMRASAASGGSAQLCNPRPPPLTTAKVGSSAQQAVPWGMDLLSGGLPGPDELHGQSGSFCGGAQARQLVLHDVQLADLLNGSSERVAVVLRCAPDGVEVTVAPEPSAAASDTVTLAWAHALRAHAYTQKSAR